MDESLADTQIGVSWSEFMFTGIIEETGNVVAFKDNAQEWSLAVTAKATLADLAIGDSIAVNGCCLIATRFDATRIGYDVLEDTRRLTNFGSLEARGAVNLERSLRLGGKISG